MLVTVECIVFGLDFWNKIVIFSGLLLLGKKTQTYLVSQVSLLHIADRIALFDYQNLTTVGQVLMGFERAELLQGIHKRPFLPEH